MKTLITSMLGAAAVVAVTLAVLSASTARGSAPSVIPQGKADNGIRAMQILHGAIDVLVQKMNADIEARNRQAFATEVLGTYAQAQACMLASAAMERRAWDAMACDTLLLALEAQNGRAG